jgi:hypothetical protein
MKSAKIDVSDAASQTQILKPIHSKAIVSMLDLYLTVMCTMTSYAAVDCHFRQDAHRRMALIIASIRCAEERERGERAPDHQTVNGEKLFMSATSAEYTEVEYVTERNSESPPPDGTKTDKGDTATRKRRRGFAPRIQVGLDSSSYEALQGGEPEATLQVRSPAFTILEKNSSILAWPSLAEHGWSEPAPVAIEILISRKCCVKMSGTISRPSRGSTPQKLRFLKKP